MVTPLLYFVWQVVTGILVNFIHFIHVQVNFCANFVHSPTNGVLQKHCKMLKYIRTKIIIEQNKWTSDVCFVN